MFIRLETSSGMPISRQIADQVRSQCASGALLPGARLPSVRALALELAVNQNTILRVYEKLTAEGLLERRHGDGTYVADRLPAGQLRAQKALLRQEMANIARRARNLDVPNETLHQMLDDALNDERKSNDQGSRERGKEGSKE